MATVYIEARPKGREGTPIDDYVVEDHADNVLRTLKTQLEAIAWAKSNGHSLRRLRFSGQVDKLRLAGRERSQRWA